jgi:peptidoglycan/xylan/chitin deacetylase (PgdA/CDA1 family)
LIRELPRGPFGAYLRAHHLGVPGVISRFAMGYGAIFMIQRVRAVTESLLGTGAIAETDPLLLEEMVSLVLEQGLDVVPLSAVRARLASRENTQRFVCFTFDGAYKSMLDTVVPLFRKRHLPYTLFVSSDYLETGLAPWWTALEALIAQSSSIRVYRDRKAQDYACGNDQEKRDCYARLFRSVADLSSGERAEHIALLCAQHNIDIKAVAAKAMLTGQELKALAADPLVTIGSQGGGTRPLPEMSYDEARDDLALSLERIEAVIGVRPRHIAFPGTAPSNASPREFGLAAGLEVDTAVTAVEGALWPEHAAEPFTLPRIALDNDPATLVRALMLSAGSDYRMGEPAGHKAIA